MRLRPAPRWADVLAGAAITCLMSGTVSGLSTARSLGLQGVLAQPWRWLGDWGNAFLLAWPVAFLLFWLVAPGVRRAIARLCHAS